MSLLPDRHPNLDFFVLDIADAVPKDDMASMEHPLFSLATKPDMRHLEYRSGDNVLKIRPSGLGLPNDLRQGHSDFHHQPADGAQEPGRTHRGHSTLLGA